MQQHGVVATAEGISCSVFMYSPSLHPENVFAGLLKCAIAGDGADALPAGDALGIVPVGVRVTPVRSDSPDR